jgi:hypothetical protein
VGFTKADLPDLDPNDITPLYGVIPAWQRTFGQPGRGLLSHEESEKRLLAISRELAKAIQHDTSLLRRAKDHIERLLTTDQGMAKRDLQEWRDILENYSIQRLAEFLTSSSARADRLRQSNPFFAVLTSDERMRLINRGNDDTGSA